MAVLRTFILRTPEIAAELVRFLKVEAGPASQSKWPLQVVVSKYRPKRSPGANRYMWGPLLDVIAQQACVAGRWFDAETWHEHMKQKFLPEVSASGVQKWNEWPDGSRSLAMSTGDLNDEEFSAYLEEIHAYAVTDLGVVFDGPA